MKTCIFKICGILSMILCLIPIWTSISAYAAEESMKDYEIGKTNHGLENEEAREEKITVNGLEGLDIKEIIDVRLPLIKNECGIFHVWNVTELIQEGICDMEGIYNAWCSNCGATGIIKTVAPGHTYADDVCTDCGLEVAPDAELAKWTYTLDARNQTISLKKYMIQSSEIIVYGAYKVNGVIYKTILNSYSISDCPFYGYYLYVESIIIKHGVVSTSCNSLFAMPYLTHIDLTGLDTSNVTDMSYMFVGRKEPDLELSTLDTSNVTDMSYMFGSYQGSELDISNFDTSNVINMHNMFSDCSNLTELDVSNFDTSNVTDMNEMFSNCSNLTELDVNNFDTSNVTDMNGMFFNCGSLQTLDLSGFKTFNVDDMRNMFLDCSNLSSIYVSRANWNTSFADTTDMFKNCGVSRVTPK